LETTYVALPGYISGCGAGEAPLLDEKPKTHISLRSADCWRWRRINKKKAASGLSERIRSANTEYARVLLL
jgi:hypothetical protein